MLGRVYGFCVQVYQGCHNQGMFEGIAIQFCPGFEIFLANFQAASMPFPF
jgi:hypothetical protein